MFETFSVSGVNLKKLFPNVYPCALKFNRCPLCGSTLIENYVYAIQISEDKCVKTHGNACRKCEAFFSTQRYLLNKLEGRKTKDNIYILKKQHREKSNCGYLFFWIVFATFELQRLKNRR